MFKFVKQLCKDGKLSDGAIANDPAHFLRICLAAQLTRMLWSVAKLRKNCTPHGVVNQTFFLEDLTRWQTQKLSCVDQMQNSWALEHAC